MAVPKKRTGHSAQGKRRANWKAIKPTTTKCPNCGETVLAHTVCTACGYYKGKPVSKKMVSAPVVEEPKKAKEVKEIKEEKPAKTKKTSTKAKKAEVVEETKENKEEVKTEKKGKKAEKTSEE